MFFFCWEDIGKLNEIFWKVTKINVVAPNLPNELNVLVNEYLKSLQMYLDCKRIMETQQQQQQEGKCYIRR